MAEPRRAPTGRWPLLAAMVTSLATVLAVAATDYLPTHDGPHHLFQGYLSNHFGDAATPYARYFEPGAPISSLGFTLPFALLEPALGWRLAYTATLTLIALIYGWGFFAFVSALSRERRWLGLLGFGCALGWGLFMGLFSYVLAIGMGWLIGALALRLAPWRWPHVAGLALALTLQCAAHLFGGLSSGLLLLCLVLAGAVGPRRRALTQLVVMSLPVGAMVLMLWGAPEHNEGYTWLAFGDRLALIGRLGVGGPAWRTLPIVAVSLVGMAMAASRWRRLAQAERGLVAAATVAWVLALATPLHLPAWQLFSPRFIPLALMWAIPLLPVERWPRRALAGGCLLVSLSSLAWAGSFHRRVRARVEPALAGLSDRDPSRGPRLTIVLDPYAGLADGWGQRARDWAGVDLPFYAPLFNLGPLYAVGRGGVPAQIFSNNPLLSGFVKSADGLERFPPAFSRDALRDPSVLGNPELRGELLIWLALLGRPYDETLLYGESDDVAQLVARGYQPRVRKDGLLIAGFEGCSLTLTITDRQAERRDAFVELGHGVRVAHRRRVPAATLAEPHRIALEGVLCGQGWVRVVSDRDGSGGPSNGDGICLEADAQGRVAFEAEGAVAVRCRL